MTNDDNSKIDDIDSGYSGFTPSSVDDLFDIIDQTDAADENQGNYDDMVSDSDKNGAENDTAGFVQDDSFVNSLDFTNGFSDGSAIESTEPGPDDVIIENTESNQKNNFDFNFDQVKEMIEKEEAEDPSDQNLESPFDVLSDTYGINDIEEETKPGIDVYNVPSNEELSEEDIAKYMDLFGNTFKDDDAANEQKDDSDNICESSNEINGDSDKTFASGNEINDDSDNIYEFGDVTSETNDGFELNDSENAENLIYDNHESIETDPDESEDELEDELLDDEDFEQTMIITEGTTITGSITTDCSLDVYGTINGDIFCNGKLSISGKVVGNSHADEIMINAHRIEGNIESEGVVKIGQGAVIIGNISAGAAAIAGAVKGDIDVKGTVIVDSTAVIKGNIKAKSVQLINGAVLEGFCSLEYANSNVDDIFN